MHYNKTITLKNSTLCTIRNADERDGEKVLEVFLLTHSQTDFLLSYPDENTFSAEDESRYLKAKTESCDEIEILAEINGKVIGTAGFEKIGGHCKVKHRADFGIGINEEYWGLGVGSALTAACIECAKKASYKQLELQCVAENKKALNLYKKFGFVEFGRNPLGFNSRNSGFQKLVYMRLEL